jgi:phenylalanyl-tRNA synthetase alpha chain
MLNEIQNLTETIKKRLVTITDRDSLEAFKLEFLVKKGAIQALFDRMKDVPKEQKPVIGKELNILRSFAEGEYAILAEKYSKTAENQRPSIDLSLPGRKGYTGSFHPILQIMDRMIKIFTDMGFTVANGPEIEDNWHNFDALNFAPDHPARDMQDTFFVESPEQLLLRTHTSPVQIRLMQSQKPPIRSIMPGRVYRNEAINARSLAEFHQIEGLYVDKGVSLAELKATMVTFAKKLYGNDIKYIFRPSYFPFTEPSAEFDINCFICGGKGCRICKHSGWLEICGSGMVHPNVLRTCGIDPEVYSGFAFGFGIERTGLLSLGLDDIRLFYENDIRVLEQF